MVGIIPVCHRQAGGCLLHAVQLYSAAIRKVGSPGNDNGAFRCGRLHHDIPDKRYRLIRQGRRVHRQVFRTHRPVILEVCGINLIFHIGIHIERGRIVRVAGDRVIQHRVIHKLGAQRIGLGVQEVFFRRDFSLRHVKNLLVKQLHYRPRQMVHVHRAPVLIQPVIVLQRKSLDPVGAALIDGHIIPVPVGFRLCYHIPHAVVVGLLVIHLRMPCPVFMEGTDICPVRGVRVGRHFHAQMLCGAPKVLVLPGADAGVGFVIKLVTPDIRRVIDRSILRHLYRGDHAVCIVVGILLLQHREQAVVVDVHLPLDKFDGFLRSGLVFFIIKEICHAASFPIIHPARCSRIQGAWRYQDLPRPGLRQHRSQTPCRRCGLR